MEKRLKSVAGMVTAVLIVAGVAWAADTPDPGVAEHAIVAVDVSAPSTIGVEPLGSTVTGPSVTSATFAPATSTTEATTTSTTQVRATTPSSTSTSISTSTTSAGQTTSTTIDDHVVDLPDGRRQFDVGAAGSIAVDISGGRLVLASVKPAAGWSYEVEKSESDDIRVEFEKGDDEAEIRVRIRHRSLEVEIDPD